MKEINVIEELAQRLLAKVLGMNFNLIKLALILTNAGYTEKRRPKKSGGIRIIHAPRLVLKTTQKVFLGFLYHFETDEHLFAFQPNRSPVANAKYHIWLNHFIPDWVLRLDLKDAFPSIVDQLLQQMFSEIFSLGGLEKFLAETKESQRIKQIMNNFWQEISKEENDDEIYLFQEAVYQKFIQMLVKLATYEGCLPQGAPTSPYLLNLTLVWTKMVEKIAQLCQKYDVKFSIYCDDITISSLEAEIPSSFRKALIEIIQKDGWFKINPQKTQLNHRKHRAHLITGIKLTYGEDGRPKLTLSQRRLNTWRGLIHKVVVILEAGKMPNLEKDQITISQIQGYISWIKDIYRESKIPPSVREPIIHFQTAWRQYKKSQRGK